MGGSRACLGSCSPLRTTDLNELETPPSRSITRVRDCLQEVPGTPPTGKGISRSMPAGHTRAGAPNPLGREIGHWVKEGRLD